MPGPSLVTGEDRLGHRKYAFRVPTLRNVALTSPYFYSGSAATLREAMEFCP